MPLRGLLAKTATADAASAPIFASDDGPVESRCRSGLLPLFLRRRRALSLHLRLLLIGLAMLAAGEVLLHRRQFAIRRPDANLDPPFHVGCHDPVLNDTARANAAIVMLARNSDARGAVESVVSVQEQFNRHFGYPWVFLNDKPWSREFKRRVNQAIEDHGGSSDMARFETVPNDMWGFPENIDQDKAWDSMREMKQRKIRYAGQESYHHMCRFQSGFFFDHPALREYRWYWRVEPEISLTCEVTYDPFVEMERNNKRYGYTIALWELGKTVPSLFRKLSDYKAAKEIPTSPLWTAMIDPSWAPWPLRSWLFPLLRNRDAHGDAWNMCHFWSNFEIADMDFFRSAAYRDVFRFLDADGGFYYERWGDAPVHSLAAAMLLRPEQVHHFADLGYVHADMQYCTFAPTDEGLSQGNLVPNRPASGGSELGCRCDCDHNIKKVRPTCFNQIRQTVM